MTETLNILTPSNSYKPFRYGWAFQSYLQQRRMMWIPEEVELSKDLQDWKTKLTDGQKHLVTQIFRFFTQGDVDIATGYLDKYIPQLKPIELRMMLTQFAATEALHIHAYSLLIDSLEMPESEYLEFMKYKEMKEKHEYLFSATSDPDADPLEELAFDIAVFSAFGEGIQLFSSFAILLNFPRHNLLEKMGRIVTWSIRDESLHVESMIRIFHSILDEAPHLWTEKFKSRIYAACRKMVELEDHFIDLAFEMGDMPDLKAEDVKQYVRYIADRRLLQLHLKPNYGVKKNPIPWIEKLINVDEFANFFETEVTEYSSAALTGQWADIYDKFITSQEGVENFLALRRKSIAKVA